VKRAETQVVAYTSTCHSMVHVFELAYPAVMVFIAAEFGQGKFALGIMANLFALGFGVTALPAGFLSDRIGSKRLIVMTCLGSAIAAVGIGTSSNIYFLGFTMALLGLATGLYHPAGLSLIAKVIKAPQLAFAYHGMAGNLGMALAPFIAVGIASLWNWRTSYLVFAAVALLLAVLVKLSSVPGQAYPQGIPPKPAQEGRPKIPRHAIIALVTIYIAYIFFGFVYRGSLTFLPLHLAERARFTLFDIDPATLAGSFATIALLFGILGQYVGGHLARRIRPELLMALHAACVAIPLVLMGIFGGGILVALACIFAFLYFIAQPVYATLIATYAPPQFQGRAFGISFFLTFGMGSFAAGFGGYIAQNLGTHWVFITMASLCAVLLMTGLFLTYRAKLRPGAGRVFLDHPG